MIIELQPKVRSRNPHTRRLRLDMLERGWTPVACEAKANMYSGWQKGAVTPELIEQWNSHGGGFRELKGSGVRLEGDIFVIDLDISIQEVYDAVITRLRARWPEWFAGALERTSGGVKRAFFGRISKPYKQNHTHSYTAERELLADLTGEMTHEQRRAVKRSLNGQKVEAFGGATNGRYFAWDGPHSTPGRLYGPVDPARAPWNVRLDSLPIFPFDDVGALIDICDEVMAEHLARVPDTKAKKPGPVYDLKPGMTFITQEGHEETLESLEDRLPHGGPDVGSQRGLMNWVEWSCSDSKAHCNAFIGPRGRLVIHDFMDDVTHYWEDDKPAEPDFIDELVDVMAAAQPREAVSDEEVEEGSDEEVGGDGDSIDISEVGGPNTGRGTSRLWYTNLVGHSPTGRFIHRTTRETWPAVTVDKRLRKIRVGVREDARGHEVPVKLAASTYIMRTQVVEQMSWVPGAGEFLEDTVVLEGGLTRSKGNRVYNLYREPPPMAGDPALAGMWVDHVHAVYSEPGDAEHIIRYLACTVQHPGLKINHALLLGGAPGIGKDTILVPVRLALGEWNFIEVRPPEMFGQFNKWQRTVLLRINEMHDLGDESMFSFYERMKSVLAAPPEVLRVNEKNLGEYYIPNVLKVVMTTNHKEGGIYLTSDDRRHYVAWSQMTAEAHGDQYFDAFYRWFDNGGVGHVVAYLRGLDLSSFDAKAPPVKTAAFWSIVNANRSVGDANMGDVIALMADKQGKPPGILTVRDVQDFARGARMTDVAEWLAEPKHRRHIPSTLERIGYLELPNPDASDGRWRLESRKQAIYRHNSLSLREAIRAVGERMNQKTPSGIDEALEKAMDTVVNFPKGGKNRDD